MPSKSEKQRKFFGAVMGAKKGKGKVKGAAKKVAKEMPKKEIKKFLKKESYDEIVNGYLKSYLIEAPYVEYEGGREDIDPREGMDEPQDHVEQPTDAQMMYQTVKDYFVEYYGGGVEGQELAMRKLHFMDPDEIKEVYHAIDSGELESGMSPPAESLSEDEEGEDEHEHCEHAAKGCKCDGCEECKSNQEKEEDCEGETKKAPILQFYGFTK